MAIFVLFCNLIFRIITCNHPPEIEIVEFPLCIWSQKPPWSCQGALSHLPKSRCGYHRLTQHPPLGGTAVTQCPGKVAVLSTFLISMTTFPMPTLERKTVWLMVSEGLFSTLLTGKPNSEKKISCLPRNREKETQEKSRTRYSP